MCYIDYKEHQKLWNQFNCELGPFLAMMLWYSDIVQKKSKSLEPKIFNFNSEIATARKYMGHTPLYWLDPNKTVGTISTNDSFWTKV